MMIKPIAFAAVALSFLLTSACDRAADEQKKANQAQAKANEKIAEVAREADQKIKNAQAEADKKIAEAQASFMKLREDYRHTTTEAMVDLDKKVADLEAKAMKSRAKAKTDLELKVKQLKAGREAFLAEYKTLETASAGTWDETKARLDKQWNDLKAMAD
jgi:hypothetical protein